MSCLRKDHKLGDLEVGIPALPAALTLAGCFTPCLSVNLASRSDNSHTDSQGLTKGQLCPGASVSALQLSSTGLGSAGGGECCLFVPLHALVFPPSSVGAPGPSTSVPISLGSHSSPWAWLRVYQLPARRGTSFKTHFRPLRESFSSPSNTPGDIPQCTLSDSQTTLVLLDQGTCPSWSCVVSLGLPERATRRWGQVCPQVWEGLMADRRGVAIQDAPLGGRGRAGPVMAPLQLSLGRLAVCCREQCHLAAVVPGGRGDVQEEPCSPLPSGSLEEWRPR